MTFDIFHFFIGLVHLYAATKITEANIMNEAISSDGSKSIQSLALRVQERNQVLDWWNHAYVWLVVFGVIATAAVCFATFMVVRRSKELSLAQQSLSDEKDKQAAIESQNRDLEISAATERAGNALKGAAKANARAEELELARAQIEKVNLELKKDAASAGERIENLKLEAERLHKENLDLEASLSPRCFKDQQGAQDVLLKSTGTKAIVECLKDIECRRAGGQIAQTLVDAKWSVTALSTWDEMGFFDGVTVSVGSSEMFKMMRSKMDSEAVMALMKQSGLTLSIASSLVSELNRCGIESRRSPPTIKSRKIR